MIVSFHVTHTSAGGVEGLNGIISKLEKAADGMMKGCDAINEYLIVRTCNRFEVYTATEDTPP